MSRTERSTEFDRDGFVVVRQFLTPPEMRELHEELERYIRDVVPTLSADDAFYQDRQRPETLKQLQRMQRDPWFKQLERSPHWQALAEELIGEPCVSMGPEWFNKPPGGEHPTPPHQDNFYFCLEPANVATLWLSLDRIDDANGCLRYVRGSHRKGLRPHARTQVLGFSQGITDYDAGDTVDEVAVALQPGDLVAHHGETIHRADPNTTTGRQRRALAIVFRGESCRRDEARFAHYEAARAEQHADTSVR